MISDILKQIRFYDLDIFELVGEKLNHKKQKRQTSIIELAIQHWRTAYDKRKSQNEEQRQREFYERQKEAMHLMRILDAVERSGNQYALDFIQQLTYNILQNTWVTSKTIREWFVKPICYDLGDIKYVVTKARNWHYLYGNRDKYAFRAEQYNCDYDPTYFKIIDGSSIIVNLWSPPTSFELKASEEDVKNLLYNNKDKFGSAFNIYTDKDGFLEVLSLPSGSSWGGVYSDNPRVAKYLVCSFQGIYSTEDIEELDIKSRIKEIEEEIEGILNAQNLAKKEEEADKEQP